MICKECGAYNPDHATYCKVCAANLKGEPVVEAPEAIEEDPQPTKRFNRPSWVVPEQTRKTSEPIKEPEEPIEESVEEATETIEEIIPDAPAQEDEPEEEASEEPEELWTPAPVKHTAKPVDEDLEDEDEADDADEDEEENEDVYNEEEALDSDDDSFEYEPTPPKRSKKKKKGNTLFTVLLIAIIVVIVCILVAGGLFLLSTNGVLKCTGTSISTLTNCSGAKKSNANTTAEPDTTEAATTPDNTGNKQPEETEATLEEYIDEETGVDTVAITLLIPAKATVTIDFPHQPDWVKTNTDDIAKLFMPKIPAEVFYFNEPLETSTQVFTPKITVMTEDGEEYTVNCPSFTRNFAPLSITLTAPIANEDGTIMAAEGNVLHIEGKINEDTNVKLMINDVETRVYEGGIFMYDYTMTGESAEDITLTASKNNYVTASTQIHVDPYVFVPEKMTIEVKDDIASLRADKSGKLTVSGTTLPGATLTAVSDNQDKVFCGTVTVDAEGKFSFQVTMDTSFYGISTITLDATKEGAEDGSTKFVVSRAYKDYDEFTKAYRKISGYKEINGTDKRYTITIPEMLANENVYATNSYGFRIFATVQEVIEEDGVMYVKMVAAKTNEVIYVKNMSAKWQPKDNVGTKYRLYCNYIGTYKDTGSVLLLGWFCIKDKK